MSGKIVSLSEKILKNTGTGNGAQTVPGIFSMKLYLYLMKEAFARCKMKNFKESVDILHN